MSPIFRRELLLVALAGTIVIMGLAFIIPLFPIYVSQMGANNFQLGLIISGFTISQFLVQPFFGGFSDRHGRKPFMVAGLACYGIVALFYIFAQTLPQVFLIRLLHGLGAGMIWPAMMAYVIDLSPADKRGEAISLLSAVEAAGLALGPFLGGLLFGLGGMTLPFFSCALLAFASMGMIWFMIKEKPPEKSSKEESWWERYGFSSMRLPDIRLLCLIGFSDAFVWGSLITILPVMATSQGIPPEKIGWLFSAFFLIYIVVQSPVGKWSDRQGRKKPILLGLSIYMLAVFILSQGGTLFHLILVLTIAGAGLGIYSPSIRAAIADLSSDEKRGANMGFFFTTRMIGFFLGPNASGVLADRFGQGFPLLVGAALLGMGIWASLYLSPALSK